MFAIFICHAKMLIIVLLSIYDYSLKLIPAAPPHGLYYLGKRFGITINSYFWEDNGYSYHINAIKTN